MTDLALKKELLSCPGDTIKEHIDFIGMSQKELASRLGRSISKTNELIKGKAPITQDLAHRLATVLGSSAKFWLNLERHYQDELAAIAQMEELETYEKWIAAFPLPKMKALGLLPNVPNKAEIASALLGFFRIASPAEWKSIYEDNALAFKIDLRHTTDPYAISVWLRLGELQAEHLQVQAFDKKVLRGHIAQIQNIAYEHSATWLQDLQSLCASCGLALVYTPCITKAPIYGAARWIRGNSLPLIQITDRRKDYNAFWFSFFHELAHILLHGKKGVFIEGNIEGMSPNSEKEQEADEFASRMLLTTSERKEVFSHSNFSKDLVCRLSKKLKKHPGIIVGQVQREHQHLYNRKELNSLKPKVNFEELGINNAFFEALKRKRS